MTHYIEQRRQVLKEACMPIFKQILPSGEKVGYDASPDLTSIVNQLAYRENQVFERLYTPMQYEQFLPITDEAGKYATEITYDVYDQAGKARPYSGKGGVSEVEIHYERKRFPVLCGSVGYSFTQEELRQAAFLQRPIPVHKAGAAMEAYRRHMNHVGLFGEEEHGLTGLYNNPDVPKIMTTQSWEKATTEQILTDVNKLIHTVWGNTSYNDMVDTIVLAPKAYAIIASRPRSDHSDLTVLRFLEQNNFAKTTHGHDITIRPGYGLDIMGEADSCRMIGYVRSEQRLVMHVPLPLRFLPPQFDGLKIFVPGEYKYSGVEFRYPLSACYMDGL